MNEHIRHSKIGVALFMKLKKVKNVNDKQLALSTLETLPNDVSLHDIREELEILESIKEGQQAAREGRTKTQEEVEQMFASWNSK